MNGVFHVKHFEQATTERGTELYQITRLPPDMILCVNAEGAMRLMNRASRTTIWNLVKTGQLRGFNLVGNVAIPLIDIAGLLGLTETQVYNLAITHRLLLWQMYPKGK